MNKAIQKTILWGDYSDFSFVTPRVTFAPISVARFSSPKASVIKQEEYNRWVL